jgi:hypothetical protein
MWILAAILFAPAGVNRIYSIVEANILAVFKFIAINFFYTVLVRFRFRDRMSSTSKGETTTTNNEVSNIGLESSSVI